jgi:hypothetical protein
MGNFFIALLLAIGGSGWVYSKFQRSSGGNTQRSLTGAIICGLIILVIIWTLLNLFVH